MSSIARVNSLYDPRGMPHSPPDVGQKPARNATARAARPLRALLHLLCAYAVLFVASVHQPPGAAARGATASDGLDLSDYILPDGTLPVLCLTPDDADGNPASSKHGIGCDACRLTATPELLAPSGASPAPTRYRIMARPWIADTASSQPVPIVRILQRGAPVPGFHA